MERTDVPRVPMRMRTLFCYQPSLGFDGSTGDAIGGGSVVGDAGAGGVVAVATDAVTTTGASCAWTLALFLARIAL